MTFDFFFSHQKKIGNLLLMESDLTYTLMKRPITTIFIFLQGLFLTNCLHVYHRKILGITLPRPPLLTPRLFSEVSPNEVPQYTNFDSFEERLLDYLTRNDTTSITVEGYVTSKRSLGKQLAFADFQLSSQDQHPHDICQGMLRKEYFVGDNYAGYRKCLMKGTKLKLVGKASPTRNPGNAVLLIQSMELMGLPRQVQHIQIILSQCKDGRVPTSEVASACHLAQVELEQRFQTIDTRVTDNQNGATETKLLKEMAKAVFSMLPDDTNYPAAANQKEISKQGNFIFPEAPKDWIKVPDCVLSNSEMMNPIEKESIQDVLDLPLLSPDKVSISGWVQNRRRFQNCTTMISLVDNLTLLSEDVSSVTNVATNRLSCLVHAELLKESAGLYRNLLAVGSKVCVEGVLLYDKYLDKSILWVQQIRLARSSSQSVTIRYLLDLMAENKIDLEEGAEALLMPYNEALQLCNSSNDVTERQWKANQLAVILQAASHSMKHVVSSELLEIMEHYRPFSTRNPVIPTDIVVSDVIPSSRNDKNRIMPIGMPGSKWQAKKKPQLEWMGQQIRTVLESHPDFGKRKLSILDIGGGKGALANYLGQTIKDVQIHVVDICAGAVANGEGRAKRLNTPVEFQIADASSSDVDSVKADLVVALHACGHLSDVALDHAIQRRAGFVIVPCCFNSNSQLKVKNEAVHDWLGLPPGDWSGLKLLAEIQGDISLASDAIGILCAVRAENVRKKLLSADPDTEVPNVEIRSFPIQYSTRNTVLVGMCVGEKKKHLDT
jgi:SAM-dependent methyltransferase